MIKVFVSQPMNGKTEEEILMEREKAAEIVKEKCGGKPIMLLDSYFADYSPKGGCIPLKYLAKAVEVLADADVAYFVKGWEDARGCRIEHACAIEYGKAVIEED